MNLIRTFSVGLALSVLTVGATTIDLIEYDSTRLEFSVDLSTSPDVQPATISLSDLSQIVLTPAPGLGFTCSVTSPSPFAQMFEIYLQNAYDFNAWTLEKITFPNFQYALLQSGSFNGPNVFDYLDRRNVYSMTFVMGTPLPDSGDPNIWSGNAGGGWSYGNDEGSGDDNGPAGIPDTGSTLPLLGCALLGVGLFGSFRRLTYQFEQ